MKGKLLKTSLLTAAFAALLTITALADNIGGGTVTASALRIRAEMSTDAEIVTTVPRGATVLLTGPETDGWYPVWYRDCSGFMSAEYITFVETVDAELGTGTIQGSSVRMRDGASLSSNTLGYYNTGTQMSVIGVSGTWYKVSYNGQTGYVSSDYMTLSYYTASNGEDSAVITEEVPSSEGEKIVSTAMKYLGVPYVWAGTSPSGFDCSGLVYYVFKECGYSTNRTAASLYNNGTYVDRDDLQPGDIICFTNSGYSYIGHVGIYIGNGEFIHASSGGGKVMISSLNETYYNNHYYGARRIVN